MSKVLVTGANGFLGSWLCRRLVAEGHEVNILIRKNSSTDEISDLPLNKKYGDVTDLKSIEAASEGCSSVFHLAGVISYAGKDRALMQSVNVGGTANVIKACEGKIDRLVHLSSVVAIGAGLNSKTILNEDSKYNLDKFHLGYFETKKQAEELVKAATEKKSLNAVMVNPSTIYGAGDALKGSRKNQIKVAKGLMTVYPPGGVSIVAVEDAIDGIIAAWKIGRNGERYILSGENLLLGEVFQKISKIAGSKAPTIQLPKIALQTLGNIDLLLNKIGKSGPVPYETAIAATLFHWFENSKAKTELGINFKPADYALEKSVLWMKDNGILNP